MTLHRQYIICSMVSSYLPSLFLFPQHQFAPTIILTQVSKSVGMPIPNPTPNATLSLVFSSPAAVVPLAVAACACTWNVRTA